MYPCHLKNDGLRTTGSQLLGCFNSRHIL